MKLLRSVVSLPFLFAAAVGSAHAQEEAGSDDFERQLEIYKEYLRRGPLLMHTRGRVRFAQTMDPRALQVLADSYAKPEVPKEQVQYLLAGIATRYCTGEEHVAIYDDWRARHSEPKDAWLWYRALGVKRAWSGADELAALARGADGLFLRAAAVEALADKGDPVLLELIPGLVEAMPKKAAEKAVLVGALASALLSQKPSANTPAFRTAAVAFVHLLDDQHELLLSTKLVIARHMAALLDVDQTLIDSQAWINLLADRARTVEYDDEYVRPSFFGLEASGSRICYVIDMSDSMCKPINPATKPKGPDTGLKRNKGEPPTEDDIPWQRVQNRFDLAREHLRRSLQRLDKDKRFCVIFFGDRADLVRNCTGMMPATSSNVGRVMKAIDDIEPGAPTDMRPDGTLRGMTNLHGGLRRAFQVTEKDIVKEHEYVALETFAQGCDTIFLLSDGDPTWDDWDCKDTNYGEDPIGDPESRKAQPDAARLHYHGPYTDWPTLIEDVKRMNLFRAVEINCIGIGEVQMGFLSQLARIGLGRAVNAGR